MPVALSLVLVLFFLLMNAFFVVAEFSLVRVRKSQVDIFPPASWASRLLRLLWAGWASRPFRR